jgi:hypothetical protein
MPVHELIASPFLGTYLLVRPGRRNAVKIPQARYAELRSGAQTGGAAPGWLAEVAFRAWGTDLSGRPLRDRVLVREPSLLGYGRASYELNLGCNYDCEFC